MIWLPRNKKQTYRLIFEPQKWPSHMTLAMALTMNIQGQLWNLLYLSQTWFDCYKMKSRHIEWTECPNNNEIWPWPWPGKVRCKDLPDSNRDDFTCRRAVDLFSLEYIIMVIIHLEYIQWPFCQNLTVCKVSWNTTWYVFESANEWCIWHEMIWSDICIFYIYVILFHNTVQKSTWYAMRGYAIVYIMTLFAVLNARVWIC